MFLLYHNLEMAIVNLKNSSRKSDIKTLCIVIGIFLFSIWLCTPPGNKFAQMCFWGSNTQYVIAKMFNPEQASEYKFHWQNVKYLVDMGDKKGAFREMNKAISTLPSYMPESTLYALYKDRGNLKIYYGDYKSALDDYLLINNPDIDAKYKIALLLNNIEKYKIAIGYCNDIINNDERSYFGFSCVADTYFKAGRGLSAVRAFDLLIDRDPGKARYYIERALYRKALGDTIGYNQDVDKAKSISPSVDTNLSLVDETLRPKRVKINCL